MISQSKSPKRSIKYSSSKSVSSDQGVIDENMLMLNLINQQEEIYSTKITSSEKCDSPIPDDVNRVDISIFNSNGNSKNKTKSKFKNEPLDEKISKNNATFSAKSVSSFYSTNNNSFIEAHYEKKLSTLNKTVMKLNETLEKYIRKITSQEKEIQFINKRLREAENLNIKMLGELSTKNQAIEALNIQMKQYYSQDKIQRRRSKRDELEVFPCSFETTSEKFIKEVSELFLKELAALNIKAIEGNSSFENYFDEVKLLFNQKNNSEGIDESNKNKIEVELSNNYYLKTLLKDLIINSKKIKHNNSMKIIKTQFQNNFTSADSKVFFEEEKIFSLK